MSSLVTASAVVTLTVEVHLGSRWGSECTVEQVQGQAGREAVDVIELILQDAVKYKPRAADCRRVRIVGEPEVRTVLARESK